ncbi:MAG: phytanoyl-CoA dioxygenase, partial [Chloroflexota bacterium]
MLTNEQVNAYHERGFIVVEDVIPSELLRAARAAVDELVEQSRGVTIHDNVYDLDPGHSATEPRVRRLKEP